MICPPCLPIRKMMPLAALGRAIGRMLPVLAGVVLAQLSTISNASAAAPDLIVTSVSVRTASVVPGGFVTVASTVKNTGTTRAGKSSVRFYLSTNSSKSAGDIRLKGTRTVAALNRGKSSNATTRLEVPSNCKPGSYYVIAAADDLQKVRESSEKNNTRKTAAKFKVASPDSPLKAITGFSFQGLVPPVIGVIDQAAHTIALEVPFGTSLTALVPTITFSGAFVSPSSGVAWDFTPARTYTVVAADSSTQHYVVTVRVTALDSFALIPAGGFRMGDLSDPPVGFSNELPARSVYVSAFYMGRTEITKEQWDEVRAWGLSRGYTDLPTGGGKAANHPVHSISWHAMVKWCNARSEKEGLTPCYTVSGSTYKTGESAPVCNWNTSGYRLPTEAEWEKAARGGLSGKLFPWDDASISHSLANFWNVGGETYQTGTEGQHPFWSNNDDGKHPYSSPVGSFASNGYGLHEMAGNMFEWCWDWYGIYGGDFLSNPPGPVTGFTRVLRGGGWGSHAVYCRVASRGHSSPTLTSENVGFRLARSSVP